jgi:hypothetical protein
VPDRARIEVDLEVRNGMMVEEALALTIGADTARTHLARILSELQS